ncbi:hypothetical protein SmJEL517_g04204 [Synchytrium microbalum]|uniref:NADP-dependent oxidoreductase domain-containing protein n=1 Tax=Synchytrium microbalum TaxID=1806994 RepID=A0A507BSY9_9FUNG|nr:uncharacterized protein SmJEL517_g04204 [Synchytrium microbalum]TPX32700.1 hypothetical protein SmJEL517_g04204 [Synchytrium microbalum]
MPLQVIFRTHKYFIYKKLTSTATMTSLKGLKIILGAMPFGEGTGGRITSPTEVERIINLLFQHGHNEIDTARMYTGGNSEKLLGSLNLSRTKYKIATKAFPFEPGMHSRTQIRTQFEASLTALNMTHVDSFYLHAPDHATPFEDTLAEVQAFYNENKFTELGVSNYAAWELTHLWHIAKQNNYVLPTICQAMYNPLTRSIEDELIPACRALNISLYAYNPLCGGLLTGKYSYTSPPSEGRFGEHGQGDMYRSRFWKREYFAAIDIAKAACDKEGISLVNASHRWLMHHSQLRAGVDGIVTAVSSYEQAVSNLKDYEDGPLPSTICDAFDEGWQLIKGVCPTYWRKHTGMEAKAGGIKL